MRKIFAIFLCFLFLTGAAFLASGHLQLNVTSTAKAAGTTTLVYTSNQVQQFTGTSTQTVKLPSGTTMKNADFFVISNAGASGNITVQDNGSNTLATLTGAQSAWFVLTNNGSSNGSWDVQSGASSGSAGGSPYLRTFVVHFGGATEGTNNCTTDPCTIYRQMDSDGNTNTVSSVTYTATAKYRINITAARCSAPPTCTGSCAVFGNLGQNCWGVAFAQPSTTTFELNFQSTSGNQTGTIYAECSCAK